jgi:hypothetical protein
VTRAVTWWDFDSSSATRASDEWHFGSVAKHFPTAVGHRSSAK